MIDHPAFLAMRTATELIAETVMEGVQVADSESQLTSVCRVEDTDI